MSPTPALPPTTPAGAAGNGRTRTLPGRLIDTSLVLVVLLYGSGLFIGLRLDLAGVPMGWPLIAILALSLARYAYALLYAAVHDKPSLPPPDAETLHPVGEWRLACHFALFALPLTWLALVHQGHTNGGGAVALWPSLALLLIVFPVSSTLVSITGSLAASLNPWPMIELVRTIGPRYALLPAGLAAVLLPGSALVLLLHGLGWVPQWFAACMTVWLLLAVFVITGHTIGGYRSELALSSDRELQQEADERRWQCEHMQALDRAYASLRSGLMDEGYAALKAMLADEDDDPALYQWLLNRVSEWQDARHARAVAAHFVERLMLLERTHEALELAERYRRRSPEFRIPGHVAAPLATYAREIGHHWLADELQAELHNATTPAAAPPAPAASPAGAAARRASPSPPRHRPR